MNDDNIGDINPCSPFSYISEGNTVVMTNGNHHYSGGAGEPLEGGGRLKNVRIEVFFCDYLKIMWKTHFQIFAPSFLRRRGWGMCWRLRLLLNFSTSLIHNYYVVMKEKLPSHEKIFNIQFHLKKKNFSLFLQKKKKKSRVLTSLKWVLGSEEVQGRKTCYSSLVRLSCPTFLISCF